MKKFVYVFCLMVVEPDLQPKLAVALDGTPAKENPLSNYQLAKMIDTPVKKML